MRLIDADALIQDAEPYLTWDMLAAINNSPTIDAVPVVQCKDCKHLYDEMDDYCCMSHMGLVKICENSFCSYGERKDNG